MKARVDYTVRFSTPYHIGSGSASYTVSGSRWPHRVAQSPVGAWHATPGPPLALTWKQYYRAQRELQREQHASGKTEGYVIPGSTMKGRCRSACELLAGAFELEVAYAPNPENLAGSEHTIVSRVFGTPRHGEKSFWSNCYPDEDDDLIRPAMVRTGVQLSRARASVAQGHLYATEFGPPLAFHGRVSTYFNATPIADDQPELSYELCLLVAGLRMVTSLGGSASQGAGDCAIEVEAISVDGRDVEMGELLDNVEALEYFDLESSE